jgi:hypothetical protein
LYFVTVFNTVGQTMMIGIRIGLLVAIATSIVILLAYFLSQHLVDRVLIFEPDMVRNLPGQPKVRFN